MAWSDVRLLVSAGGRSWSGFGCQPPALLTEASCGETMSDATTAAVIVIVSVGVVISYPSLMYPPLRTPAGMGRETQLYTHKPQRAIRDADRSHEELTARYHGLVARSLGQPVWEDEWFRRHEAAFRRPPLERWWAVDLWGSWAVWKILAVIFVVIYALR